MSDTYTVQLYVYDLSHGLARSLAPQLLGFPLEGIWHTSVVVYGKEYLYGQGIQQTFPGTTQHGQPYEIVDLGTTEIPQEIFEEYLLDLSEDFTATNYDLFAHNCNHFSEIVAEFLSDSRIPEKITGLPEQVLRTPFGQMIRPMMMQMLQPITTAPLPDNNNMN